MSRGRAADIHRHAAIIAYHDGGKRKLREVGARFGVTRERIRQVLVKYGVDVRRGGSFDEAVHRERLEKYKSALPGRTSTEAKAAIGLPGVDIYRSARVLGVKAPAARAEYHARYQEIADFYASHPEMTGTAVAKHFGVAPIQITRSLRWAGVPSRRSGWSWKASHAERQQAAT